ncbi:universal stress protein [Azohydromonas caseinilytica]|uniref:Universal stress protein n=1 Tax=Azohydromonas caseinilytica TaxID=2728836 RepID=A0A848F5X0_9BURK|nr:universal stress protein [Azohydromonas caseinilytica]NML14792.1 universal stress protein [Azohydromonas caseinilytica]
MSDLRRIVVHLSDSPRARAVALWASSLADEHGAELHAVHAVEATPTAAYLTPEATTIATQLSLDSDRTRIEQARTLAEELGRQRGQALPFESVLGDPLPTLLRHARSADLLVLGQHDPETPDGTAAGLAGRVLMGAGCPLLFVPYADADGGPRPVRNVLAAWNDSRESARALRDALPLLRRAQNVELVRFVRGDDEVLPLEPLLQYLAAHGVRASGSVQRSREPSVGERLLSPWTPDAPVAEALLSRAADLDADLIVIGGYGHTRAWELALGGVTRTLLQSMTVPVLMSH